MRRGVLFSKQQPKECRSLLPVGSLISVVLDRNVIRLRDFLKPAQINETWVGGERGRRRAGEAASGEAGGERGERRVEEHHSIPARIERVPTLARIAPISSLNAGSS